MPVLRTTRHLIGLCLAVTAQPRPFPVPVPIPVLRGAQACVREMKARMPAPPPPPPPLTQMAAASGEVAALRDGDGWRGGMGRFAQRGTRPRTSSSSPVVIPSRKKSSNYLCLLLLKQH